MKKLLKTIYPNFITFQSNNGQEALEMFRKNNEKTNHDDNF